MVQILRPASDNLNINTVEALQKSSNIGSDTWYNVATGTSQVVPWGVLDWISKAYAWVIVTGVIVFLFIKYGLK